MNEDNEQKAHGAVPPAGGHRDAIDAEDVKKLKANPSDDDGKIDVNVDESFPASDPSSVSQPRKGTDGPLPGGKYD